jgi:predicted DsbA family dithiol-disulfide isomerase
MSPSSNPKADARAQQILILAIAGAVGMMGVGAMVGFLLMSAQDQEPAYPQPAKAWEDDRADAYDAPAAAPNPTPLDGAEQGYGRPEPLFPDDGDAEPPSPADDGRVEVRSLGGGPETGTLPGRWGNAYAPVKLVVFNDFECPFCSKLEATFEQLHERYPTQIEIHFRDYPLTIHKHARSAHMAARCANDQGRFWAMHDLLFANQRALTREDLLSYAAQLSLDTASFERCLVQEHHAVEIENDMAAAKAAGVSGTPATFVNGTLVSGARPVDGFIEVIDAAL